MRTRPFWRVEHYSSIMADIYLVVSEHDAPQHGRAEVDDEEGGEIQRSNNSEDDDDDDGEQDDNANLTSPNSGLMSNLGLRSNLERFAESENIFNRQMVARSLLDTLRSVVNVQDDVATVLSILLRLSDDIEPSVRAELVEQAPSIAAFCNGQEGKGLEEVLPRYILPFVVKYLADPNNQVRRTSQEALVSLLEQKLLGTEEFKEHVFPVVLLLSHLDSLDHFRTEAVSLMSRMASLLGKDLIQSLFLDQFIVLCTDTLFQVRKLSRFISLCNDGMWGVRKACADVFVRVSCVCSLPTRRQHLAQLFVALLSDQSRWVRMAAFQSLGPFISTFADFTTQNLCYHEDGEVYMNPQVIQDEDEQLHDSRKSEQQIAEKTEVEEKELEDAACSSKGGDSGFGSRETTTVCSPAEDEDEYDEDSSDDDETNKSKDIKEGEQSEAGSTCEDAKNETRECASPLSSFTGEYDLTGEVQRLQKSPEDGFNNFQYWRHPIPTLKLKNKWPGERQVGISLAEFDRRFSELNVEFTEPSVGQNESDYSNKYGALLRREEDGEEVTLRFRRDTPSGLGKRPVHRLECGARLLNPAQYRTFHHQEILSQVTLQDIVPHELLHQYVKMTDQAHVQSMDSEIVRYCAHSLPAVTLTLGRKHWPLLRHLYECLASDMQWKVRRTLAFSIHELAAILGRDLAASDLVPVFNNFIRDLDEVRVGILRHLARFLSLLPASERNSYLPKVKEFVEPENERNWRFRLELAEQLSLLAHLFGWKDVATHLLPIAVRLLEDRVAEVRLTAANAIARLVTCIFMKQEKSATSEGRHFLVFLAKDLVASFAEHSKWHKRQTFANVCLQLRSGFPDELFNEHLLPSLLELSTDPVANVRLSVAKALNEFLPVTTSLRFSYDRSAEHGSEFSCVEVPAEDANEGNCEKPSISRGLERLRNDKDRDVREAAGAPSTPCSYSPKLFPSYSSGAERDNDDEGIAYGESANEPPV